MARGRFGRLAGGGARRGRLGAAEKHGAGCVCAVCRECRGLSECRGCGECGGSVSAGVEGVQGGANICNIKNNSYPRV